MTNKECARISAFSSFVIRWSYEQSLTLLKSGGNVTWKCFRRNKRVRRRKKELMTTSTDITVVRGGAYTKEEDNRILELYEMYSTENTKWKLIASEIQRGHKSVRERYVNHLDPTIDKSDLTIQEKHKIDGLQSIYMKKWADIAKEKPDLNLKGLIPFPSSYL
ncbi:hypothetical protein RhiirA4_443997 [Rhizophagus irregularis]|uniref:Uncharacterized protein n=1 Tax=Rhizophagus irregularis TaxID=588596 RepID=A0A2I1GGX0_9GLOM|nr:hypothetical protein RhiirA4_443997 [Rhizophagus irregularis]